MSDCELQMQALDHTDIFGLSFTGCVPLDPQLSQCLENGQSFVEAFSSSPSAQILNKIAETLHQRTAMNGSIS